jgi:hypothetical protein
MTRHEEVPELLAAVQKKLFLHVLAHLHVAHNRDLLLPAVCQQALKTHKRPCEATSADVRLTQGQLPEASKTQNATCH